MPKRPPLPDLTSNELTAQLAEFEAVFHFEEEVGIKTPPYCLVTPIKPQP